MAGQNQGTTPKVTEHFKKTYGGKNTKQDCRCRKKGEYRCGKFCKKAHKDFKKSKKATKMLFKKSNMKKRTRKYRGGTYKKSRKGGFSKKRTINVVKK